MLTETMEHVPYEARNLRVCIDAYHNGSPEGRLYSAFEIEPFAFSAVMPLVRHIEDLLDATMHTQRFEERRALIEHRTPIMMRKPYEGWREAPYTSGKLATFTLHISFRQNASWQGEVTWNEPRRSCFFRSALELLCIIDDVLLEQDDVVVTA